MPFPVPLVAGLAGGAVLLTGIGLRLRAIKKKTTTSPPDFKASPPAAAALPPKISAEAVKAAKLPVITQAQFAELTGEQQQLIRDDALRGMLTFTGTNGTLFADGTDTRKGNRSEDFIGVFKPGMLIKGNMLTVDASTSSRFGLNLAPVTSGSVLFEATADDNGTHIPAISRDPRMPNVTKLIPLAAITGGGDP